MGVRRGVGFFCRCFNALGGGGRGRLLHVVLTRWSCVEQVVGCECRALVILRVFLGYFWGIRGVFFGDSWGILWVILGVFLGYFWGIRGVFLGCSWGVLRIFFG